MRITIVPRSTLLRHRDAIHDVSDVPRQVEHPNHDGTVVVYNPGSASAETVIEGLSGRAQIPLLAVTVGAGRRLAVHLNSLRTVLNEPLVVSASVPVYVEADSYGTGSTPGISLSFGVPLTP